MPHRSTSRRVACAVLSGLTVSTLSGVASAAIMTYNRAAAVAYATANWNKVVADGYFWTDSGTCTYFGAGHAVPTNVTGDDCAHFVSSCIGTPSGAGIAVHQPFANSSTASYKAQYGDPNASGLTAWLVSSGDAQYVSSVNSLVAGDVISYDWGGDGHIDHTVLYMGNGKISAHATSHLNVAWNWSNSSYPNIKITYVHITVPDAVATPEPTTLALLGLPMLAFKRRRG